MAAIVGSADWNPLWMAFSMVPASAGIARSSADRACHALSAADFARSLATSASSRSALASSAADFLNTAASGL
jgi:hypothetical protein